MPGPPCVPTATSTCSCPRGRSRGRSPRSRTPRARLPVDLHAGFAELEDRGEASLFARSVVVDVQGVHVRVFGPEDHLRLVALHLLRHGGTRPIWLTDVAAMVEAGREPLDWDLVLAGKSQAARAVGVCRGPRRSLAGGRRPGGHAPFTPRDSTGLRPGSRPSFSSSGAAAPEFRLPLADA